MKPKVKPCVNCPFIRGHHWNCHSNCHAKISAIEELSEHVYVTGQRIFSCHMKHPEENIFSLRRMKENDCAGFQQMLENMHTPNTHPSIVNNFNETGPEYDMYAWARHNNFRDRANLLIENKGNIKIINLKKNRGASYDLYIGRQNDHMGLNGSKWANPFHLKAERDRLSILEQHWNYLLESPDLIKALPELAGKTLACYCCDFQHQGYNGKLCHGMNLIRMYDQTVN